MPCSDLQMRSPRCFLLNPSFLRTRILTIPMRSPTPARVFLFFVLVCLGALPALGATITVSTYGALPDDGVDDTAAINNAISAAVAGDIVTFASGTYDLIAPSDSERFIRLSAKSGITLQGATSGGLPTTKLLRHLAVQNMASPPRTLYGVGGGGLTLANFIIDNTPHLCTSGTITAIDPAGKFIKVQIFAGLPMVSGTACYSANVWTTSTRDLKRVPSLTETSSPANWTIDDAANRIMKLNNANGLGFLSHVAVGELMSWHYGWNGRSQMEFSKVDGLTLQNLIVRNAVNMAVLIGATNNITLTNITLRPEGNQLPVGPRDAIHISRSTGAINCSGLDITGVRLDGFVVRAPYAEITSITSPTQFRIQTELYTFGQPIAAGTSLSLISATGNLYNRVVSSATYVSDPDVSYYDVVTASDLPSFATVGTPMKVGGISPASVSITGSNFENIAGSSMILFADNITVDDVDNFNVMYPAIHIGANSTAGICGSNITIKNSVFDTCGWVLKNGKPGMITIANDHSTYTEAKLKTIAIQGNVFSRQFFASTYPSINVFETDTIDISGNLWENVWRGLKIDTATVTGYTVAGNSVVIDNDGNSSTYTETGAFAGSSLAGYNASGTRYASGSGAKAEWSFICPKSGSYRVYIYKVQHSTSDSQAKISVENDGATAVQFVDYTSGASGWMDLGAYTFTGQATYKVINERSNGYLRADAVRYVQQ